MQFAKNRKISPWIVWVIAFVCFASISVFLIMSFSFYGKLDSPKFSLNAFVIPEYKKTPDDFQVIPLNSNVWKNLSRKNKVMFRDMLVKQYIVNRYTVTGQDFIMERNLGLSKNSLGSLTGDGAMFGTILKSASIDPLNIDTEKSIWTDAYKDFISGKDGEREEIEQMKRNGVTRSVRIIGEPKKVGDWIVTKVEFIYREPTTISLKDAKRELYEIAVNISLNTAYLMNSVEASNPSSIFKFVVRYIEKRKL